MLLHALGVLWLGEGEAVPGAQEVIKLLREKVRTASVVMCV